MFSEIFCWDYFIQRKWLQGCLIAPTLSIGSILLQQAAITASFHYNNAEIVESKANPIVSDRKNFKKSNSIKQCFFNVFDSQDFPSMDAIQISKNLSNLGQIYNREDISTDVVVRFSFLLNNHDGDQSRRFKNFKPLEFEELMRWHIV